MLLSNSQLSMRPLCSDLLFTLVDYIFVICLTKCLSWLVRVQSRSHSSDCIYTVISLLFYCSKDVIQFWAVTWAMGSKKWLEYQGCLQNTKKIVPVRVFRGPWTLPCPQHESQRACSPKFQWNRGASWQKGWIGSRGPQLTRC